VFSSERELEEHVRRLLTEVIIPRRSDLVLLENKKVADIVICRNHPRDAIFFIEVKMYNPRHGRLRIGQAEGKGFQPEVVKKNPDYLESNLRWVIVDGSEEELNYLFVPTSTVKKYILGKVVGKKFNNIDLKIFGKEGKLDEKHFIQELDDYLR